VAEQNDTTLGPSILFDIYLYVYFMVVWLELDLSPNLAYDLHIKFQCMCSEIVMSTLYTFEVRLVHQ
jgi:hypothetical protein